MTVSETLTYAFQITLVGMGLVFAALILLWGLMALLVRIAPEGENSETAGGSKPDSTVDETTEYNLKRRAAAAAVAVALMQADAAEEEPHTFPLPATAIVSAWQAVTRANQLNQKGARR
ncbi:MAG: OadG family protein [Anaerolinea sp.]|nr:OadG family protein [Anaerolinea sp.]